MSKISQSPKFWRRNFLIYPRFQIGLIFGNTLLVTLFFSIIRFQISEPAQRLRETAVRLNLAANHPFFSFIEFQAALMDHRLLVSYVLCVSLTAIFSLFFSHRLVGPIVRMRSFLLEFDRGELPSQAQLRFRRGDFFSELPELLNRALKRNAIVTEDQRDENAS